jgi:hypothetical protein
MGHEADDAKSTVLKGSYSTDANQLVQRLRAVLRRNEYDLTTSTSRTLGWSTRRHGTSNTCVSACPAFLLQRTHTIVNAIFC